MIFGGLADLVGSIAPFHNVANYAESLAFLTFAMPWCNKD
jgi:hypothetical protein